jgi:hypothetical protein
MFRKESFTPVYFDSENYYKQSPSTTEQTNANNFSPSEQPTNGKFINGYSNVGNGGFYDLEPKKYTDQKEFIQENGMYNTQKINGVPLKDYYEKYTNDVLTNGTWLLNKDMPQDTKQYLDNSQVQQRMEQMTGLRQQRDRETLGKPNRTETKNLFTPEERITGYGYQYGQSGKGGPGFELTRQKEIEEAKLTFKFKTNEQPIEKIHVGPGLALGTEVPAAGGFQQYTRVVPDNISNHSSNQLPGTVCGEKWAFSNAPTSQQPVMKNRVNGFYSLCQYGPMPSRGTVTAPLISPDYTAVLKNQNRSVINYGFGTPLTQLNDYLATN